MAIHPPTTKAPLKILTYDEMTVALAAAYPRLQRRPLREFGGRWAHIDGIWTGGTGSSGDMMPDGFPIFSTLYSGHPEYDGPVHAGFEAWLEARGWGSEWYDGDTFFLMPLNYFHGVPA
jgi:hypothetical protein